MIRGVKELHTTKDPAARYFYHYLICAAESGRRSRYHLIRVNQLFTRVLLLGNELSLDHCRRLIRLREPKGTRVSRHRQVSSWR
jgi:hypothetical protein